MTERQVPALNPEEWQTKDYRQRPRVLDDWATHKHERRPEDDATEYVAKLGLNYDGCVIAMNRAHDRVLVPPPARAALAAFSLYEQPFGFTRDDITALREASENARAGSRDDQAERLLSLVSRLEALLPPDSGGSAK
jgi:hypothetical protein